MKKKQLFTYAGLGYKALQRDNRIKRNELPNSEQIWLKDNGYSNLGWTQVIALFDKIKNLLEIQGLIEWSLEDLFLEADRIGEKYQEPEDIQKFQLAMATEAEQISEIIDQYFPDNQSEVIDFSLMQSKEKKHKSKSHKKYCFN
jgi:hypothetical protein